ncbi:MAG: flagellar basal body rod protein FlgC [Spirochaetaceae bacterium]|nr:flagellar basal body rod protein FlgC [Spirochaetaceae bacterium]MBQ8562241.1 flagellar basal body rod protein FlgC [Spirochaetaceae bacterium]MBR2362672.1 flagellar basal body rod protein FlgC [Spirochaetaceae bacterium]MBR2462163.1 flagellar basal body rod protein FlgC [Spirochaetaceae bacterium]
MGLFTSINIAATGMSVERLRTDVIANNIANASTTRTPEGGKFQRQTVVLQTLGQENLFRNPYVPNDLDEGPGLGVKVSRIVSDTSEGRMVYDPSHPDAIKSGPNAGYVEYPNVNVVNEMVDLISASRAYEANSSVIQGSKEMFNSALQIAK